MRARWRLGITILTAWMMVIQPLLMAYAAAGPQVDRFGNPLCITETEHATSHHGGSHHAGHHHGGQDLGSHGSPHDRDGNTPLLNCCTLACGACAAVIDTPRENGFRHVSIGGKRRGVIPLADQLSHGPEPRPGSPRAPPLLS